VFTAPSSVKSGCWLAMNRIAVVEFRRKLGCN